jgi:hypothetical protein
MHDFFPEMEVKPPSSALKWCTQLYLFIIQPSLTNRIHRSIRSHLTNDNCCHTYNLDEGVAMSGPYALTSHLRTHALTLSDLPSTSPQHQTAPPPYGCPWSRSHAHADTTVRHTAETHRRRRGRWNTAPLADPNRHLMLQSDVPKRENDTESAAIVRSRIPRSRNQNVTIDWLQHWPITSASISVTVYSLIWLFSSI